MQKWKKALNKNVFLQANFRRQDMKVCQEWNRKPRWYFWERCWWLCLIWSSLFWVKQACLTRRVRVTSQARKIWPSSSPTSNSARTDAASCRKCTDPRRWILRNRSTTWAANADKDGSERSGTRLERRESSMDTFRKQDLGWHTFR